MRDAFRYWLFDLDNTLYSPDSGLFDAIDQRVDRYLQEFFDILPGETAGLRRDYHIRYGLTIAGLMRERGADPEHYMEYVHRVPVKDYLRPNPRLRGLLGAIPAAKAVYTNGSRRHSRAVLQALGVHEAFDEIFDLASVGYIPKPDPRPYRTVLDRLGAEAGEVVMVEDLPRNLVPAREMGMTTVLVGACGNRSEADFSVSTVEELRAILPLFGYRP